MQKRQIISGFSELKDLLVRKYKINEDKISVRLYFTMSAGVLTLHDYDQHDRQIILAEGISASGSLMSSNNSFAGQLINLALKAKRPEVFLNEQFKLHGFFRF